MISKRGGQRKIIHKLIFLAIFSYVVFGNALTFNLGNRLPIKLSEIISFFVLLFCFFFFISQTIKKRKRKKGNGDPAFVLAWVSIGLFSAIISTFAHGFSLSELLYGLLYLVRIVHIFVYCWVLVLLARWSRFPAHKLANCILYSFVAVCVIGFFQVVFFPIAADWYDIFYGIGAYWPDPDPHIGRLISTYFDPNYLASILIIPICIALSRMMVGARVARNFLLFALFTITILLTKSRSGIVGLAITLIFFLGFFSLKKRNPLWFFGILFAALPIILYLVFYSDITVFERIRTFSSDDSASHRFESWSSSIQIILDNPLFGVGYNMFGAYQTLNGESVAITGGYGTDSSILFLLITTGFSGGLVFLLLISRIIFRHSITIYNVAFKAIIVASLVMSFFNNLLFNTLWLFPVIIIGRAGSSAIPTKLKELIRRRL